MTLLSLTKNWGFSTNTYYSETLSKISILFQFFALLCAYISSMIMYWQLFSFYHFENTAGLSFLILIFNLQAVKKVLLVTIIRKMRKMGSMDF